jgi:predicted NAD/FAD-dependent oxidoreductase
VQYGVHVRSLGRAGQKWQVQAGHYQEIFDDVIIATPPWISSELMAPHDVTLAAMRFKYEPITTCYLQYEKTTRLPLPFYALIDTPSAGQWGQFVFDRGQLDAAQAGLFAVVISASSEAASLSHDDLATAISRQLADAFGQTGLARPQWSKVITEKRATFACTPDLSRPVNTTACAGVWLAGDYTQSDYPATIEGAVRSGILAAGLLKKNSAARRHSTH